MSEPDADLLTRAVNAMAESQRLRLQNHALLAESCLRASQLAQRLNELAGELAALDRLRIQVEQAARSEISSPATQQVPNAPTRFTSVAIPRRPRRLPRSRRTWARMSRTSARVLGW
jgi:hypothetical protein